MECEFHERWWRVVAKAASLVAAVIVVSGQVSPG